MQIALVAVVLLAGMWFTVLRPKSDDGAPAPAPAAAAPAATPTSKAPGMTGLANAVNKAKAAHAAETKDNVTAANASAETATAGTAATPAATKAPVTKSVASTATPAAAKAPAVKSDTVVDPSDALLRFLAKGKTVVLLFHGDGADDRAARKAVHRVALKDHKVVAAYAPIARVGLYQAITSGVEVTTAPTILVIGSDLKAITLTGYVDQDTVAQAVGDIRRAEHAAAAAAKSKAK